MSFQLGRLGNPSGRPKGINFELPEGGIDTGDNMLEIAHWVTESVACGLLTIEEAEKFTEFLNTSAGLWRRQSGRRELKDGKKRGAGSD